MKNFVALQISKFSQYLQYKTASFLTFNVMLFDFGEYDFTCIISAAGSRSFVSVLYHGSGSSFHSYTFYQG